MKTVTGLFRQSLASIFREGKEANLPSETEGDPSGNEGTNFPPLKHNLGTAEKNYSNFSQVEKREGQSETESERRGMDVNVKFTFDDSRLGEEEFADVSTPWVAEQRPAAELDLRGKLAEVLPSPVSLPLPRGTKQPVYFDPQVCHETETKSLTGPLCFLTSFFTPFWRSFRVTAQSCINQPIARALLRMNIQIYHLYNQMSKYICIKNFTRMNARTK